MMNRYWAFSTTASRRLIWSILVFVLAAVQSPVYAQPRIQIDQTTHQFGDVYPGEPLRHDFKITNTGTEPLEIKVERTSCGCTAGILSATRFMPGGSGIVSVTTTPVVPGVKQESAYLTTNDPTQKNVTLIIVMTVKKLWDWQPNPSFVFPTEGILVGTEQSMTLYLKNEENQPFRVLSTKANYPELAVLVGDATDAGIPITVKVKAGTEKKVVHDQISILTDHPKSPTVRTTVFAKINGYIKFDRTRAFFSKLKPGETRTMDLTVSLPSTFQKEWNVTNIISDTKTVTGRVKGKKENGDVTIELTMRAPDQPGYHSGNIHLTTTLPEEPSASLPFSALVVRE